MNAKPILCVRAAIMLLMLLTSFSAWAGSGDTYVVDVNGGGDYTSISAAVSAATGGETIFIKNGEYSETSKIDIGTKQLTFTGESQDGVIIKSGNNDLFYTTENGYTSIAISNLTFKDISMTGNHYPIYIGGDGDVTIEHCTFDNCESMCGAMYIYTSGIVTIDNCTFLNTKSSIGSSSSAIDFSGSSTSDWTISNTIIDGSSKSAANNSTYICGAIYNEKKAGTVTLDNVTIRNCNLTANGLIYTKGNMSIKNSTIVNNYVHRSNFYNGIAGFIFVKDAKTVTIETSMILNNRQPDYFLTADNASASFNLSYNNIQGNTFSTAFTNPNNGTYTLNANYWGSNTLPNGVTASTWVVKNNEGNYVLNNGDALPSGKSIPECSHNTLTEYAAVSPKCTDNGNTEYWQCNTCGKYFSDDAGTTEIAANSWVVPATGHQLNENHECNICHVIGIPYLDESGNTQYCTDFTVLTGGGQSFYEAGWYVVNSDIEYTGNIVFYNHMRIILADGATMTVNTGSGYHGIYSQLGDLTIYGQEKGTGTLNINATSNSDCCAIRVGGTLTVNGGTFNLTGKDSDLRGDYQLVINGGTINTSGESKGISSTNVTINGSTINASGLTAISYGSTLTVNGGMIAATGAISGDNAIFNGGTVVASTMSGSSFTINGGNITAGSVSTGSLTLGMTDVNDSFYFSTYSGPSVTIASDKTFYDGTGASISNTTLLPNDFSALAGKTLRTFNYLSGTCGDPNVNDGKNVTWVLGDKDGDGKFESITISGTGDMVNYSYPSKSPWDDYYASLTSVVIEDGVTSIGERAFRWLTKVTAVSFGSGVTTIGKSAFELCNGLTSVIIPNNVTNIDEHAFDDCENLATLSFGNGVTSIGSWAFQDCKKLETISFGSGLTKILQETFKGCTSLSSVNLPASLKSIGSGAFAGCNSQATVTLNSNPNIAGGNSPAFDSTTRVIMNLTATVGESGEYWMTFYNMKHNFQVPATGTQIFKAALSEDKLTLRELTTDKIVTKNNAVILKSETASITLTWTTSDSSNDFSDNSLSGVEKSSGKEVEDPSTTYALNSGTQGVGFYKVPTGNTIGVGNAYVTSTSTSDFLSLVDLLKVTKEAKTNAINEFPVGNDAFYYSSDNIADALQAIEAATTVEEVEAVAMPIVNAPAADKAFQLTTPNGNFLVIDEGVKMSTTQHPFYFTQTADGKFTISNDEKYVVNDTNDDCSLTTSADEGTAYTVVAYEGGISIQAGSKFFGFDNDEEGASIYRDKDATAFGIGNYVAPLIVNDGVAVEGSEDEKDITYVREFKAENKWQSLFLPFSIDMSKVVDVDVVIAKVVDVEREGNEFAINIVKAANDEIIPAKTPLFIAAKTVGIKNIKTGWSTVANPQDDSKAAYGETEFYGMLEDPQAGIAGKYIMSGGELCLVPASMNNLTLGVFRWYMSLPDAGAKIRFDLSGFDADEATGIISIHNSQFIMHNEDEWYDMSGRKLQGKPNEKGIYICNGKKVTVQ